jgi:hypothetical protein
LPLLLLLSCFFFCALSFNFQFGPDYQFPHSDPLNPPPSTLTLQSPTCFPTRVPPSFSPNLLLDHLPLTPLPSLWERGQGPVDNAK